MNESHRLHLRRLALMGPAEFFAAAFSPDELASRFENRTAETSRDFLVLRTLAEVQKFGLAAGRWDTETKKHASGERFDKLALASLHVERAAWQRRLLEALVTFVNFSTTNQLEYYAHFLAVHEHERERFIEADERDFFGASSDLTTRKIELVRRRVDEARARLPTPPECWYLNAGDPYRTATFRKQYLRAMKFAHPAEKTALGYTYQLSFGAASELLHFSVLNSDEDSEANDHHAEALCNLLSAAILRRAHELCGVEPQGINVDVMRPENRDRPVSELLSSRAEVGDFVLVAGPHIAEVREIRRAEFGYESYRLEFLDGENGPGLREDWLPAPAVGLFMRRREMIDSIKAHFAEPASGHAPPTEEELGECARDAVIEVWRSGVRQYYVRQSEQRTGNNARGI